MYDGNYIMDYGHVQDLINFDEMKTAFTSCTLVFGKHMVGDIRVMPGKKDFW